jgi:ABC-2 type transport system permease protein
MSKIAIQTTGGPSEMVADDSGFPRWVGSFGLFLAIFGFLTIALSLSGRNVQISISSAGITLFFGLAALLYHASFEKEEYLRRPYLVVGLVFLAGGLGLVVLPFFRDNAMGLLPGHALLILGMLFGLASARHETSASVASLAYNAIGLAGAALVLVSSVGGAVQAKFLLPHFALMALTGTILIAGFLSASGIENPSVYRVGWLLGFVGVVQIAIAIGRSTLPHMAYSLGWIENRPASYWVPTGFLLTTLGALQFFVSAFFISESKITILTRRELGSFFFSPIAYIVLLSFVLSTWISYSTFLDELVMRGGQPPTEPIVRNYVVSLFTILAVLFAVPLLTMRLLSEEQRTATLEVLLTAPVEEPTVVLSKFFAGLIIYLMVWIPYLIYLLALPLAGAPEFDYRPLLSFFIGLVASGAGFIAVGLFFSSLTSNQIVAAAMTLSYMIFMLLLYMLHYQPSLQNTIWTKIIDHMSFLDLWLTTLQGKLIPRQLAFHVSITVLALFAAVKVLEARKWK